MPMVTTYNYSNLVITMKDFCLDSWEDPIKHLLLNLRSKYESYITHSKKQAKPCYDGVAKQQGMFGAFQEVSSCSDII